MTAIEGVRYLPCHDAISPSKIDHAAIDIEPKGTPAVPARAAVYCLSIFVIVLVGPVSLTVNVTLSPACTSFNRFA